MLHEASAGSRPFKILPLLLSLTLAALGCGGEDTEPSDDKDAGKVDQTDGGVTAPKPPPADAGPDARMPATDAAPKDAGPPSMRLAPLAGRYLIRLDTLGTATSPSPFGGTVAIRSRVSTLLVAELTVEGDHLVARERVCTQSIAQRCDAVCTQASTQVDPGTVTGFLLKREQQRVYTLDDDGTFSGQRAVAMLGYDGDAEAAAPTSADDERVWDVVAGGVREGFLTKLSVTLGLQVQCDAYGTQKFVSAFRGKLTGSESAPKIPEMPLDLTGSEGSRLGSNNPLCEAQEVSSPVESANARMVRFGDELGEQFWNCPAVSEFDQQLPPSPL